MQSTAKPRSATASPSALLAVGLTFAFALVLAPSLASAADGDAGDAREPLAYLPGDSRFASHVDVEKLRTSKYFDQVVEYLEGRSGEEGSRGARLAGFLTGENGFDIESDLETIAVGLPVSRFKSPSTVEHGTFVLAGDFEPDTIRSLIREERDDVQSREQAGLELLQTERAEIGFPSSNRLIVAMGPTSYRDGVWKLAAEGGTSFADTGQKQGLFEGIDRSRMVWMVNHLVDEAEQSDPKVDSAGVSIEIDTGIDLQIVSHITDEAHAENIVEQVEEMKKSGGENPMVAMLGAGPLVDNLAVERDGLTVELTTSMNEAELDALVASLRQMVESQSRMSMPSSGAGGDGESSGQSSGEASDETDDSSESNGDKTN